jgi:hypothetical protein
MATPSAGVTSVNSGLAVLVRDSAGTASALSPEECRRACSTAPTSTHCGTSARGSGVMTNHPTSSSGFEEAARAGAAPPPTGPRRGPPTSNREAATQAARRETALLSIGQFRTEYAAVQIRADELTLALAFSNADNSQLRRQLAVIRIERNTFRAEAMTA